MTVLFKGKVVRPELPTNTSAARALAADAMSGHPLFRSAREHNPYGMDHVDYAAKWTMPEVYGVVRPAALQYWSREHSCAALLPGPCPQAEPKALALGTSTTPSVSRGGRRHRLPAPACCCHCWLADTPSTPLVALGALRC